MHPDFGSNPRPQDFKTTLYQHPQATGSNVLLLSYAVSVIIYFFVVVRTSLRWVVRSSHYSSLPPRGGYTNVFLGVQVQVRLGAILSSTSGREEILGAREPRVWERDARHWTFPVSRLDFKPWFAGTLRTWGMISNHGFIGRSQPNLFWFPSIYGCSDVRHALCASFPRP